MSKKNTIRHSGEGRNPVNEIIHYNPAAELTAFPMPWKKDLLDWIPGQARNDV